jgi:hypothetical protein
MTDILGVGGNRLVWTDLPLPVRAGIEELLGASVIDAVSEPGGFSPGLASRVALADGRRLFVKAVSSARNEVSAGMFVDEVRILAALQDIELRAPVAVPAFVGQYRDDEWIALVISEVAGRQPAVPWRAAELDRVVDAISVLGDCLTPNPLAVPSMAEACADSLSGWRSLAGAVTTPEISPWAAANLDRLAELESGWSAAATGDTLLHSDLRADNLLLTDDEVYVVDWPHACVGAAWVDLLVMLPSVIMQGGDPNRCWQRHPAARAADRDQMRAVFTALTGYFVAQSLLPSPPGLPRLRAFQRAQGTAALGWLRVLLS